MTDKIYTDFDGEVIDDSNADELITSMVMELCDVLAAFPDSNVDERAWECLRIYIPNDYSDTRYDE